MGNLRVHTGIMGDGSQAAGGLTELGAYPCLSSARASKAKWKARISGAEAPVLSGSFQGIFGPMAEAPGTVIVIDDDVGLREALGSLLRSVGLQASLHGSVSEFVQAGRPDGPSCLVLDVRLPGQGGLHFQRELTSGDVHVPLLFITGHGAIPMSVQAMKGGAIEFLTKPFRDPDLLNPTHTRL